MRVRTCLGALLLAMAPALAFADRKEAGFAVCGEEITISGDAESYGVGGPPYYSLGYSDGDVVAARAYSEGGNSAVELRIGRQGHDYKVALHRNCEDTSLPGRDEAPWSFFVPAPSGEPEARTYHAAGEDITVRHVPTANGGVYEVEYPALSEDLPFSWLPIPYNEGDRVTLKVCGEGQRVEGQVTNSRGFVLDVTENYCRDSDGTNVLPPDLPGCGFYIRCPDNAPVITLR